MNIIKRFSVNNDSYKANVNRVDSRYRTFQDRGPKGLMLHSVGCSQPSAEVFARSWDRSNYQVSVHAVLQADGTVYQCLPWNFRAWHCGGDANNTHVGVEMTEPAQIKYTTGANFTCTDLTAARAQCRGTYQTAADLFAELCVQYKLDPMEAIISHAEGARKGVASNHGDPEHLWKGLGMGYTMDTFRAEVKRRVDIINNPVKPDTPIKDDDEEDIMSEKDVRAMLEDALGKIPKQQPVTRQEIMAATGDLWIGTYMDVPESIAPEVMELIRLGALRGTAQVADPEDTAINMPLSTVRAIVICLRTVKAISGEAPREALAVELEKILELIRKT